jgi:endoglucanase
MKLKTTRGIKLFTPAPATGVQNEHGVRLKQNVTAKFLPHATAVITLACALGFFPNGVHAQSQRGRPHLNAAHTTFVADNGQNLRGPYTSTEWTTATSWQNIASMKSLGFNAVHLYAESFDPSYPTNGSTAPGYHLAEVDKIVAETRTNGLYLIMTIGNGANNGNYNLAWITNFWNLYGARYANETHVLYEIQNEPVAWGPPYSAANATPPGGLNMEIAAYRAIRANAPNTPVLLFTYAVFGGTGGANAAMTDIHAFNTTVFGNANAVWTNEAVAFHGYNGWSGTRDAVTALLGYGYPCVMTEYGTGAWGSTHGALDAEMTSELERLNVSWLSFQYVPPTGVSDNVSVPDCYSNIVVNSGLSWTPDYGNFPAVRGPYGNGGQPRTVPASYVSSFLTGTPLRIQAEDFDTGGEGVAYHELTTTNLGGQYRTNEAVDIETTTDAGGGYHVAATAAGEWIEYTIWIQVAGYYNLSLRYATGSNGCAVQMTGNGHDRTGSWALPSTGGSATWATATKPVLLEFGRQKMRIHVLNGGFNLNWMELTPASTGFIPNGTYKFLNAATGLVPTAQTTTNLVVASNYSGSTYQQWNLQHVGGGQYKITAVPNGYSWSANNKVLTTTSGWGTGDNRSFIIAPTSGSFFSLLPVGNGVPVETSTSNPNAIDENNPYSGGANQQWAIAAPSAPMFPTGLSAAAAATTQVNLTWNAVAGATSYNIKRSATSGGPYTTTATGITATNYTDTIPAGMKYYYVVTAVSGGAESPNSLEATVNLPYPWLTQDIGSVGLTGSASLGGGVFTVTGAGADIWGTSDAFRFAYVAVTGNCTMVARVASVQNIDGWSKAGIMIRESMNASAANAYIAVTPGFGVSWQTRSSTGGNSGNFATAGLVAPYWVKLVRSGTTFTGYRSPDGVTWTQQGTQSFTMASTAYIGLALTSHNNSSLCTATFDNVTAPGWINVAPPSAPASLAATVTNWNVVLNWPAAGTATSYNVKRAVTFGGPYTVLGNVTTTNYTDATPVSGTNYYYVASALNVGGESANSAQAVVPAQVFSPSGLSATVVSGNQVALVWNTFTNAANYNVKRSPVSGGPYTTLVNVSVTNYTDPVASVSAGCYYVVSALVAGSETPNSAEAVVRFPKLAGAIIGTAGSYNGLGDTIAHVFDNNLNTFFDGPVANGCWVGLDFGAGVSNVITQINYCPRSGFESRMVGGIFQGANQAGFGDAVTLYTVTAQPATGVFTSASVANAAAFRYVRFLSPSGGWGNVAELEFYGYASAIPNTNCPAMSMAVAGTSLAFSWPLTNAGFTLQWSTNLVPANWINVTSAVPQMVGNQWQVTLPPPGNGGPVFYRLSQ